jgi:type I restriction enzyme M protein
MQEWIKKRYIKMLGEFKEKSFSFEDVSNFLFNTFHDSEEQVKNILSELKKEGYLDVERKTEDKREKIYKLKSIFEISENKINSISQKDQLINLLKQAADLIRTRVDYTFILFLLFYKAYSDIWEKEFENIKEELLGRGWPVKDVVKEASSPSYHIFNFPEEYLWDRIRKDPQRISEKFSIGVKKLAELNPVIRTYFLNLIFINLQVILKIQ